MGRRSRPGAAGPGAGPSGGVHGPAGAGAGTGSCRDAWLLIEQAFEQDATHLPRTVSGPVAGARFYDRSAGIPDPPATRRAISEIEIPEELRALQQARAAARRAADVHDRQSTIARRQAAAAAGDGAVLPWPQDVLDRMEELREDYNRAVAAIREHPIVRQAQQDGTYNAIDHQLRLLVPVPVVAIVRDTKAARDVVEVSVSGVVVERDGQPVQPA